MLSETHLGAFGLQTLLSFYRKHSGTPAIDLSKELKVHIKELESLDLLDGYLRQHSNGELVIEIPACAWMLLQSHTIYHELAHWCLFQTKQPEWFTFASHGDYTQEWGEVEYWCDSFATAMLFAREGVDLLRNKNPLSFLTAGTRNLGNDRGKVLQRRDIFQGIRLTALAEAHPTKARADMIFTGRALVFHALQRKAKLSKAA